MSDKDQSNPGNDIASGEREGFLGKLLGKLGTGTEFTLEGLAKLKSKGRDLQGPLNGIFGDKLDESGSNLALPMRLYKYGEGDFSPLEIEKAALKQALPDEGTSKGDRICIFIHGLASSEKTWLLRRKGERPASYAELLRRDTGHVCYFVRYNTGRHISLNGRALADLLEAFVKAYPRKIREINLIGHSMGGLVSRSAGYYAGEAGHKWLKLLTRNFLLGSPLLGAHQEQIGKLTTDILDLFPATRLTARFLDMRSSGIQDLGYGYLRDEDWNSGDDKSEGAETGGGKPDGAKTGLAGLLTGGERAPAVVNRRKPVPLIKKVRYFLVLGSVSKDPESIIGSFLGDGVVNRPSAMGEGSVRKYEQYEDGEIREIAGLNHVRIPGDPRVYRLLRDWLRD